MLGSLVHLFRERAPACAKDENSLLQLWRSCEAEVTNQGCARNPLQQRFLPLASLKRFGFTSTQWKEIYSAQKNASSATVPHSSS